MTEQLKHIGSVLTATAVAQSMSLVDVNDMLQTLSLISAIVYTLVRIAKDTKSKDNDKQPD